MWDSEKRERFQALRMRAHELDPTEQAELATLTRELEAFESAYLNNATQRLRLAREQIEQQNRSLESLAARRSALVRRLESVLSDARAERTAIDSELALVLTNSNGHRTEP